MSTIPLGPPLTLLHKPLPFAADKLHSSIVKTAALRAFVARLFDLKKAVDFNAESQRCRVMQRKSEVLRGNGKYKNFSDRVNLHQLGVACMVLQK